MPIDHPVTGDAGPPAPPHFHNFAQALEAAVQEAAREFEVGEEQDFTVALSVRVRRENPGRIEAYHVSLNPGS